MAVTASIQEMNTGSLVSSSMQIKTKRFDFGIPDQQKRISKVHLVYLASSAVTVEFFIEGSGTADTTLSFASQATMDNSSQPLSSVGKSFDVKITCSASDFQLDSMDVDYEILGSNP